MQILADGADIGTDLTDSAEGPAAAEYCEGADAAPTTDLRSDECLATAASVRLLFSVNVQDIQLA